MPAAAFPENEDQRLKTLRYYGILDTPREKDFDEIIELASQICQTPISTITLIDDNRQWFKAEKGLNSNGTSRDIAFCSHAILHEDILLVEDATKDERFIDNPLVTGHPEIRFYAGMPLITEDGYKLGTLCVIDTKPKEITESQKYGLKILAKQVMKQIELRVRVRQLDDLNEANRKILSIIGHDLRSPLSSLTGLLILAENGDMTHNEFLMLAGQVKESIASADTLLANLLHWATAQFEGKGAQIQKLKLRESVSAEADPNKSLFASKSNTFSNQVDPAVVVNADPDMLRFVIRNLIVNANKFTSNGTISVSSKPSGNMIKICIEDSGTGMTAEKIASLFDWSKRSSSPGTKGEKGSGFGLQVCKELIEKMGGTIYAESEVGKGTRFYFTLPSSPH
jgi:signal transduction histidine kinase